MSQKKEFDDIFDDDFDLRYQDVRKFGRMHLIKKDALENNPYFAKLGWALGF